MAQPVAPADFGVALVCMPFASADRPSIQLGLVGAVAEAAGFPVDLLHFNLDLAAELTPAVYELLCERRSHMTGEWLFAPAAFGPDHAGAEREYFERFPDEFSWCTEIGQDESFFVDLRRVRLPAFVDRCLAAVDWDRYRVVGFSSLFQQNVASLALARRIKERHEGVAIVFGGANMEGEMGEEYARAFPFIDHVVSGEADDAFPALLQALAQGVRPRHVPGLVSRAGPGLERGAPAAPVENLDRLPVPNYAPYFRQAEERGLRPYYQATYTVPYESARGCWWGQKHHCTFCGLNGETIGFRSKSPQRVLAELSALADRHDVCSFVAVDNILDVRYIPTLFAEIERARLDYSFFYEVKANLTREQIRTLHRGGVRRVQPGIESLSTHVLRLMRKGCTMLQNVRCMKWCAYYGIGVNWNLIWGFPGETVEDYKDELEVLRAIRHLEPPVGYGRIWLERFSPHYTDPAFPVRHRRPEASYRYVYPDHVDLVKAAYFFDYEMGDTLAPETHRATHEFVSRWRAEWAAGERHSLTYRRTAGGILIDRNRGPRDQHTLKVTGANALIYEFCSDTMHGPRQIAEHLRRTDERHEYTVEEVRAALTEFCAAGLMLGEDDKYLALALPLNPNW
ncbi:RiPP maturation radical SAM C-methyltransferase [Pseudonocardia hispaniensis]|uniref:RiPP maturation radical SAM C-methyltransferase n=1 Tax=Pseudonocardia hispaniensis TaxID=904933 RepID=A0ABW1J096_9PSEU